MKIAIFGSTSQIAKDLIVRFAKIDSISCTLFSRREADVDDWLDSLGIQSQFNSLDYSEFLEQKFDGIINLVGVGNPARAKGMGDSIFAVTKKYDNMIVNYLQHVNSKCKYIFFSSGAAYGNSFSTPNDSLSESKFSINELSEDDWYGLAKFQTEVRHRLLPELIICDLRVFSYFSETQDINNTFMMSEITNAIINDKFFETSDSLLYRDFIHPDDLFDLVLLIVDGFNSNGPVDCFSKRKVEKKEILLGLNKHFNLSYKVTSSPRNACERDKIFYYSNNKNLAAGLNFTPKYSSLECILDIIRKML